MEIAALKLCDEINKLFDKFCEKIKDEHHKQHDGVWTIGFDRWSETYIIRHDGYWLDDIYVEHPLLGMGLVKFKNQIKANMEEAIELYDFEQHCEKEFSE